MSNPKFYEEAPELRYRDKLDVKFIFNSHVQRCLASIGSPFFEDAVTALSMLLPSSAYAELIEKRSQWNPEITKFEYEYAGPIKLGRATDPLMMENEASGYRHECYPVPYLLDEDGNLTKDIDWDDPHIRSPKLVTVEAPDHMMFFRLILEAAESAGLSWDQEYINLDGGSAVKVKRKPFRGDPVE